MKASVGVLMAIGFAAHISAQELVPFTVCVQSETWTRPSPDVQSRIWTDNRYKDLGSASYEWTHKFLFNEPDSASLAYHSENLSGLWTDPRQSQCPRRDEDRGAWSEIWSLNYHVLWIAIDGVVYTVMVEPRKSGYEIIQFRRPGSLDTAHAMLRFVGTDTTVLDEWSEVEPSVFKPASRSR